VAYEFKGSVDDPPRRQGDSGTTRPIIEVNVVKPSGHGRQH